MGQQRVKVSLICWTIKILSNYFHLTALAFYHNIVLSFDPNISAYSFNINHLKPTIFQTIINSFKQLYLFQIDIKYFPLGLGFLQLLVEDTFL